MKVIYGIGQVKKKFKNAVLAIGVFDGLHIGHQALIKKAVARAKAIKGQALVMTFAPHPVHVLRPEIFQPLITPMDYRLKLIEEFGAAACIVVRFTKRFAQLTPQKFIQRYFIDRIQPKEIFVGNDFRFGHGRSGTLDYFSKTAKDNGLKVNPVETVPLNGEKGKKIGSTHIRHLIHDGKLENVHKLLGRPFSLMGHIVRGDKRGQTLGYPTANLHPDVSKQILPPLGVYAVIIRIGQKTYHGMANVGRRPSFKTPKSAITVETHIFDFSKDIYGQEIIVLFYKKIRNEKKFPSKECLIRQLKKDEVVAQEIFLI